MIPSKKYFETVPTSLRYISECTYDCFSLIMLSFLDCIHEAKASDCKGVKKKENLELLVSIVIMYYPDSMYTALYYFIPGNL